MVCPSSGQLSAVGKAGPLSLPVGDGHFNRFLTRLLSEMHMALEVSGAMTEITASNTIVTNGWSRYTALCCKLHSNALSVTNFP